jgi:hypothetical protein
VVVEVPVDVTVVVTVAMTVEAIVHEDFLPMDCLWVMSHL